MMSHDSTKKGGLWLAALAPIVCALVSVTSPIPARPQAPQIGWVHLSSGKGDLPVPHPESKQQTGALVADFDQDGAADFVIAYRQKPPALVWYRFNGKGWDRSVIEKDFLTVEAGGTAFDIDSDGDADIVFGADSQHNEVWWWENPYPNFDPAVPWKRRLIKNSGANQHHDQVFGDFKGTGQPQLVFWNQGAQALFLADIPSDPKNTEPWPSVEIFSGRAGEGTAGAAQYAEGAAAFDVDGDGKVDLMAGNYWFKHQRGNEFKPIQVGKIGGRIAAGHFKKGQVAQIVIAPGDGSGPLMFYECGGTPTSPADWQGRNLLGRDMVHGHTLDVGDINGDGHLDIFAAEMAKWTREPVEADHPQATAWILYGDGKGNFTETELVVGHGWHEGRLADLDGDGDLDILNKPYTWDAPRVDIWLNNGMGPRKAGTAPPSAGAGRQPLERPGLPRSGDSLRAVPPNVVPIRTDDQGYGDFSGHGNGILPPPDFTAGRGGAEHQVRRAVAIHIANRSTRRLQPAQDDDRQNCGQLMATSWHNKLKNIYCHLFPVSPESSGAGGFGRRPLRAGLRALRRSNSIVSSR